jgi:hypothetical protein
MVDACVEARPSEMEASQTQDSACQTDETPTLKGKFEHSWPLHPLLLRDLLKKSSYKLDH